MPGIAPVTTALIVSGAALSVPQITSYIECLSFESRRDEKID